MSNSNPPPDKFIEMVTAKVDVDLRLSDFHPHSMLKTPVEMPERSRFPAIDFHNHLDAQDPASVLRIMDACGIERIVNITMRVGAKALAVLHKFHDASPGRFSTIGWMDWTDVNTTGFFERSVDRMEELVEHEACGFKLWKDLGTTIK